MRKSSKRFLVFLLSIVMCLNTFAMDARAGELVDGGEISYSIDDTEFAEDTDAPEIGDDVSDNEDAEAVSENDSDNSESEDVSDNDASDISGNEDVDISGNDLSDNDLSGNDLSGNDVSENDFDIEEDLSDVFYRDLTAEEIAEKASMAGTLTALDGAVEGIDYVSDQVFAVADTEEEAVLIGEAYAEATGLEVELVSYQDEVAVYNLSGDVELKGFDDFNRVESVAVVAADEDNNLPVLVPNFYEHIESVGDGMFTFQEHYDDPFLDWDGTYWNYYQWYHEKIDDKFVWSAMECGELTSRRAVTVAVIDSGMDYNHADFAGAIYTDGSGKKIFKDYVSTSATAASDPNGHGTNVAGIIGSTAENGIGGRGVAAGVKLISVRTMDAKGSGTQANIISGINWCKNNKTAYNIKIVNMSLGGYNYTPEYDRAVQDAYDAGLMIIAAAGNESTDGDHYPSSFNNVVCVAALNSDYKRAAFSNFGPKVDIAAPGGEFKPDRTASGFAVEEVLWSTGPSGNSRCDYVDGQYYVGMQGTSQATPVVSACAALIFAYYNDPYGRALTPAFVETRLKETATKIKTDKPCGVGCVNIANALGISTVVAAPTPSYENKSVLALNTNLYFSLPLDFCYDDALIFYTTDGKTPSPMDYYNGRGTTQIYDGSVFLTGPGKVTVKAVTYLYGKTSPVVTYNYTFDDKKVSSVMVSAPNGYANVGVGKKLNLQLVVLPKTAKNKKVNWTSSDTTVAKVSSTGQVTGLAEGTVTITATSAENSAKFAAISVTVTPAATQVVIGNTASIDGVSTSISDEIVLELGQTCVLNNKAYPEKAAQKFILSSSNTKVATVSSDYNSITAVKSGTATITVTAGDGSGVKATIKVKVITPVTSLSIYPKNFNANVGAGKKINMLASFNYGLSAPDNKKLIWSSSNTSYATVDANGVVTGKPVNGMTAVTIKAASAENPSIYDTYTVYVYPLITGFTYYSGAQYGLEGPVGAAGNLTDFFSAYGKTTYGSTTSSVCTSFTFSSSNPGVVSIDSTTGFFRSVKTGSAKLTAKAMDGSGKSVSINFRILPEDGQLSLKVPVTNPVLYPGKSVSYTALGLPKGYKGFLIPQGCSSSYYKNATKYDTGKYVSASGMKISGGTNLKYVTPGTVETVTLGYSYTTRYGRYSYTSYNSTGLSGKIELYPAGTTSIYFDSWYADNDLLAYVSTGSYKTTIDKGDCITVFPESMPYNACQKYYTYKSSNEKVVKVDTEGNIVAVGGGTATVTVTAGDGSNKTAKIAVTVKQDVTSISVASKTGNFYVASGKSIQLTATTNADATNKKMIWSSSDPTVATVDSNGKVTAKTNITTRKSILVTATAADGSGEYERVYVYVAPQVTAFYPVSVGGEKVTSVTAEVGGGTLSYPVTFVAANTSYCPVSITTSNAKVATATYTSQTLKITPKGTGSCTIKLTALDGTGKTASVSVKIVKKITSLSIAAKGVPTYKSNTVDTVVGKAFTMTATTNSDASVKKVKWTTSNPAVCSIDASGKIKALSVGSCTISAKADDGFSAVGSNSVTIVVKENPIATVKLSDVSVDANAYATALTTKIGTSTQGTISKTKTFKVQVLNKEGSTYGCSQHVVVSSSKPDVATASWNESTGQITVQGLKAGSSVITVTSADGANKSAKITVTVVNPVKKMSITSANSYYYVAQGYKLKLLANTNEDATNKKLKWSVTSGDTWATVDQSGVLTAKASGSTAIQSVEVKAEATDGSGVYKTILVNIYPLVTPSWSADSQTIKKGRTATVTITNPSAAPQYYQVTYNTGYGRVEYYSRSSTKTVLKVYGTKAGKITLTAAATDGSGRKFTYVINVTD